MNGASTGQPVRPAVAYPALVGKVLEGRRQGRKLTQAAMAQHLGVTQSAYSRLEAGDSVINLAQLRRLEECFDTTPGELLDRADELAVTLSVQGVEVLHEKPS